MDLLVPAALAFALIIPIILLFYFMRPKRQERMVGSTLLWQQAVQDLQASRPWQRLRITPLLLLQLLAAAMIVLILARPAIFSNSLVSGDTIVILQASASMQATDVKPNRFEAAKNQIADFIDTLGPNDYLSLITMARTPQVLIANSQNKAALQGALQQARVTNQDADLQQALSLAESLAAGHSNAQAIIVGDGHVLQPDQSLNVPFPVHYLPIGTNAPNAALLSLGARTLNGQLFALAQVANFSTQQRSIPVALYADGTLVSVQTISLPANGRGALQWGPLKPTVQMLHAKVLTQDALSVDHDAWATVGNPMHGRVLLVTKGNTFLLAALRLQPGLNLYQTTPVHYSSAAQYDLTIFDGYAPPVLPKGNLLFINPPAGSYLFGQVGTDIAVSSINAGIDDANLLTDVDLSSIHTLRASHQLKPASWAEAVVTAPETPLLIAGTDANQRIAVIGFDLHDTDLPLQPGFPVLVYNMMQWFMPAPAGASGQVTAGTPVTIQTWPGADQVIVTTPDHKSVIVGPPFPVLPFDQTDEVGVYQVAQRVNGQIRYGTFTVNLFDPTQSQLAPAHSLPVVQSTAISGSKNAIPHELREVWPWVAAFLLLVLCAEWWLFSLGYKKNLTLQGEGRRGLSQQSKYSQQQILHLPGPLAGLQAEIIDNYQATKRTLIRGRKRVRKAWKQWHTRSSSTRGGNR